MMQGSKDPDPDNEHVVQATCLLKQGRRPRLPSGTELLSFQLKTSSYTKSGYTESLTYETKPLSLI